MKKIIDKFRNPKEVMSKAMKDYPRGCLVMSVCGEVFRVALEEWVKPQKDDWFKGVYYWGSGRDCICVMGENESRGYYLYNEGKWATKIDNKFIEKINKWEETRTTTKRID